MTLQQLCDKLQTFCHEGYSQCEINVNGIKEIENVIQYSFTIFDETNMLGKKKLAFSITTKGEGNEKELDDL